MHELSIELDDVPTIRSEYSAVESLLFEAIAQDLQQQGHGIYEKAIPADVLNSLYQQASHSSPSEFKPAGIGRETAHTLTRDIRRDKICWIDEASDAGQRWLMWTAELQNYLNRRLFLGLFSFESHFALYGPGDFYSRHCDAFRGQANRVLSVVLYLNPHWQPSWGGELVLYDDDNDTQGRRVEPMFGRLVVFLSEEFPHEVLPAQHDRYSIAGWFRVNGTGACAVDPPR